MPFTFFPAFYAIAWFLFFMTATRIARKSIYGLFCNHMLQRDCCFHRLIAALYSSSIAVCSQLGCDFLSLRPWSLMSDSISFFTPSRHHNARTWKPHHGMCLWCIFAVFFFQIWVPSKLTEPSLIPHLIGTPCYTAGQQLKGLVAAWRANISTPMLHMTSISRVVGKLTCMNDIKVWRMWISHILHRDFPV